MSALCLVLTTLAAEPTAGEIALLKTFHQEFIHITPGTGLYPAAFTLGRAEGGEENERPPVEVSFSYDFHIAKYEVPQNLWEAVMGSNPSRWKGPRNSVEMLTFEEAQQFCSKVTELMRISELIRSDEVIRLPSEAEWEYVARAGTTTVYSFGDDTARLDDYGWHTGNAAGNDPPVGAKKPNPWGLYDIHGYLWEWVLDVAHDSYKDVPTDGSAWNKGSDESVRIVRGGSWKDKANKLTSSYRFAVSHDLRDDAVGLRCVLAKIK